MADVRRRRQRVDAAAERVNAWAPAPAEESWHDLNLTDAELAVVAKFAALLDDPDADPAEESDAAQRAACVLAREPGRTEHLNDRSQPWT